MTGVQTCALPISDMSRGQVRALVRDFGDVALAHFAQELDGADPEKLERLREFLNGAEGR